MTLTALRTEAGAAGRHPGTVGTCSFLSLGSSPLPLFERSEERGEPGGHLRGEGPTGVGVVHGRVRGTGDDLEQVVGVGDVGPLGGPVGGQAVHEVIDVAGVHLDVLGSAEHEYG